jgi:hypothetical protein
MNSVMLDKRIQNQWDALQAQINRDGGLIFPGLYHGYRRVRARFGQCGLSDGWAISPSEADLIAAIGRSFIHEDVNRVDLFRKTGLKIRDEIAPTKLVGDKSSYPEIERTDEWGESGKLYRDSRPIIEQLVGQLTLGRFMVALIFWPFLVTQFAADNLSLRANQVTLLAAFVFPGMVPFFTSSGCLILCGYSWWTKEFLSVVFGIYAFIVFFPFLYHVFNDKPL